MLFASKCIMLTACCNSAFGDKANHQFFQMPKGVAVMNLTFKLLNPFFASFLALVMTTTPVFSEVLFFDDFEQGSCEECDPNGWILTEVFGDVVTTLTPPWSPYGWVAQINEPSNEEPYFQASMAQEGFDVLDFVFEFDMQNMPYSQDRDGVLTVLLTEAGGGVIFSAQLGYHPDPALDSFVTGLFNDNEVDQAFEVPYQQFLGDPPYAGVHVKIETNHTAGTYDLTLDGVLYADNPLGADVIGKNLAKFEFIGGIGVANHTRVWLDNISLAEAEGVAAGDFDGDGDVDGRDFLMWQRGESPDQLSPADLAVWQAQYNGGGLAAVIAVPEPATLVFLSLALGAVAFSRQRIKP